MKPHSTLVQNGKFSAKTVFDDNNANVHDSCMPPDFLHLNDLSKILKRPTKVKKAKSKAKYFRT